MAESNLNPEQHQPGNSLPGGPLPPGVNRQHPGMQQNHQRHSAPFLNGPLSAQQSSSTSSSSAEASYQLFQQLTQQQRIHAAAATTVNAAAARFLSESNNIKEFRYDPDGNIINTVVKKRRFATVMLNGVNVRLHLDTGSDISFVSKRLWEKIDLMDTFDLWSLPISTYCNNVTVPSVTLQSLKAAYPSVFRNELGLCTKTKVKLELIPGATPVFRAKRPVTYAVHSSVDNELDRLERAKIITPVDFSDWAAPIVVVRKTNGSIRICGDYSTGLNNALQPHQYPLPLPEEIFNKLVNCTVFSRIDLSDAFLQVEVDESSRKLLTINTHRGLYRYNRLAPGVKAALGAFQQLIDTMLAGLPHTCGYLDDVVVGGVNPENHWGNLHAVFQRISDFGFTIRVEKCIFAQPQIKYVGHLLDRNGLRPDPSKVQAINEMPPPTDVSGVRSFLEAINYYGKFVPSMRTLRYPLDELLKADAKFE
ncbi:uncharacterized protein K02A2.6-like [Topomyia yanbarensis]|uniref:uncharacterized protein K02A2.6-like n=1 Tax=Topomyia yanbarensis TaxID=2498891 RepID=UPI00273CDB43|nr:uncharacterized protein K02A2.6-like [Topomyia yanbarensis]